MSPEFTAQLIAKIVDKWAFEREEELEVLLGKDDAEQLKNHLLKMIKKEARDKLIINVGRNINQGFRIGVRGEETYYDFSEEAVAEILKELVNPKIKDILNSDG